MIEAANGIGLRVHTVDPKTIGIPSAIDLLGRTVGPPWQKDHKLAAVAALSALTARRDN